MRARATLQIHLWPEPYAVARLRALPAATEWLATDGPPAALVAGHGEISVLAPEAVVAALGDVVERVDAGWRAVTLDAIFALDTIGLLAAASRALAEVGVPVMVLSSHATDHLLVPAAHLGHALTALHQAGLERFLPREEAGAPKAGS